MKNNRESYYVIKIVLFSIIFFSVYDLGFSQSVDQKVNEISKLLMCPVCQGQTVADSNSNLAIDMRKIIKEKVEGGESKDQILGYFVRRYGDSILASPPLKGVNLILWILPFFTITVGFFILIYFLNKTTYTKASTHKNPNITTTDSEYYKKIEKEIGE